MPCICYGAVSGEEEFDKFLSSEKGKETMDHIIKAASLVMSHNISPACDLSNIEFRQMFVKCFLHMMIGCDERGKLKSNT
jgi:hypothetical protein